LGEGPHQVTRGIGKGQGKEEGRKMRVIMGNEMMPEVPLKVKLTPNGAPPVRKNSWRGEADKYDND
jgi:hypothetical protein